MNKPMTFDEFLNEGRSIQDRYYIDDTWNSAWEFRLNTWEDQRANLEAFSKAFYILKEKYNQILNLNKERIADYKTYTNLQLDSSDPKHSKLQKSVETQMLNNLKKYDELVEQYDALMKTLKKTEPDVFNL